MVEGPYRRLYADPRWFAASARTRARDGYRCTYMAEGRRCAADQPLSVHHDRKLKDLWIDAGKPQPRSSGWAKFVRLALDDRNLRTLCERHHKEVDNTGATAAARRWTRPPPAPATAGHRRKNRAEENRRLRRKRRKRFE